MWVVKHRAAPEQEEKKKMKSSKVTSKVGYQTFVLSYDKKGFYGEVVENISKTLHDSEEECFTKAKIIVENCILEEMKKVITHYEKLNTKAHAGHKIITKILSDTQNIKTIEELNSFISFAPFSYNCTTLYTETPARELDHQFTIEKRLVEDNSLEIRKDKEEILLKFNQAF